MMSCAMKPWSSAVLAKPAIVRLLSGTSWCASRPEAVAPAMVRRPPLRRAHPPDGGLEQDSEDVVCGGGVERLAEHDFEVARGDGNGPAAAVDRDRGAGRDGAAGLHLRLAGDGDRRELTRPRLVLQDADDGALGRER